MAHPDALLSQEMKTSVKKALKAQKKSVKQFLRKTEKAICRYARKG